MISKSLFLLHCFLVIYNIVIDERGVLMKNTIVEKGQTKLLTPQQRKWLNIWKHREFYMFLLPGITSMTRWAVLLYSFLPASYIAPSLGKTTEEQTVASGVCSLLTIVTLIVFCTMATLTT